MFVIYTVLDCDDDVSAADVFEDVLPDDEEAVDELDLLLFAVLAVYVSVCFIIITVI